MERITQIINDWDPIGFFPMAPKDEYINEIKKVYLGYDIYLTYLREGMVLKISISVIYYYLVMSII